MQEGGEPGNQQVDGESGSGPLDFGLLFTQLPDVLLILLPDAPRYTMVAATDVRLQVTHTTRDTLGKGLFEVFPDNPDDAAATGTSNLRASLDRVLATGQPDTMAVQKYDIPGPDGTFTRKYWSPKNVPVLAADGRVRYIIHRVEDVTELVDASEQGEELQGRNRDMEREVIRRSNELAGALRELREANARLAELDAAKTAFFSNISHEFRTPLTLMLAPLEEELTEGALAPDDPRRLRLDTAYRNALRLLKLVNSLLDFARIEAGRASVNFEPTDLAALTAELASSFRSAVERGGLGFAVDCAPLPEPVHVDRDMWEKIVLNLLSNAFKHTFEGHIAVRLRAAADTVTLTVEDSGVGIAAEEIPRLFERFHRVQGAASRSHEGSGIGLSLVRELVQLHGGTVQVESEPGRGSRFIVTLKAGSAHLPASAGKPAAGTAARAVRHAAAYVHEAMHWLPDVPAEISGRYPSLSGDRPRVLWADDNADMRNYVARLLGADYEVTAVADGQAALESALADPPDLVLSDVMMPRLDGFGLLKGLRADERTRRLPVILLSARAGEESALEGLDSGADDYLVKPFSARELLARVRAHVTLARERHAWEKLLEDKVRERTAELQEENTRRRHTEHRLVVALANVRAAQAALAKPRHRLDFLTSLERAGSGAISVEAVSNARDDVEAADSALETATAMAAQIQVDIERCVVRAPAAGRVLQVNTRAGEFAANDTAAKPLMLVGDDTRKYLRVDIDETDAWRIQPNAKAVAFVRGNPRLTIPLRYEYTEPYVTAKTSLTGQATERSDLRVLQVIYSFEPSESSVYLGQQMDAYIQAAPVEERTQDGSK